MKKNIKNIYQKIVSVNLMILVIFSIFIIPLNSSQTFADNDDKKTGTTAEQKRNQVCANFPPNPKESFLLSVMTLCFPGILEKYNEYREFKCQEVVCTYDAIKNNLDPTVCSKVRAYQTCKYFVGEVFALTPAAYLEYWRQAIRNLIANPLGIAYSAAVTTSRVAMTQNCEAANLPGAGWLCNAATNFPLAVAVPLVVVTDARAVYERVKQIIDGESYLIESIAPESSCDRVEEIKKELEEIIDAYEQINSQTS